MNVDHYTFRVGWSADDGEYVGTVAELPSLSWLDADATAAFAGIRRLAAEVVADLMESGEPTPEPIAERTFSGRFVVRMSPEIHRRLVIEAAERQVSLNTLAVSRLAESDKQPA